MDAPPDPTTELDPTEQLRLLLLADREPSAQQIRALVDQGANLFTCGSESVSHFNTALMICIEKNYPNALRTLLECGAPPNQFTPQWTTALHGAAYRGHEAMLRDLIAFGGNPHIKDGKQATPLHEAASNGQTHIMSLLKHHEANLNEQDKQGNTPLHKAIEHDRERTLSPQSTTIAWLIEAGADVNQPNDALNSPLHLAARTGNIPAVSLLLSAGAHADQQNQKKQTPLHLACRGDNLWIVEQLLRHGADPNRQDGRSFTPLLWASVSDNPKAIALLGNWAVDLEAAESSGMNALQWAVKFYKMPAISALLDLGACIPANFSTHSMTTERMAQAVTRWHQFLSDNPPDVHALTPQDLVLFGNLGTLKEALSPKFWQGHDHALRELLLQTNPSLLRGIFTAIPGLASLLSEPTGIISDWTHQLPSQSTTKFV